MNMITPTTSSITLTEKMQHILARAGLRRSRFRVRPGLYSLGNPNSKSHVFVTANYGLSFDTLRRALSNIDCYILVLDTKGINVWCAAGKGTFGTEELIHRIGEVKLKDYVARKILILPQLGASGIAAHEVERRTGFKVEYGPVRASDIPQYLQNHTTPNMRRVSFNFKDRSILIPVELTHMFLPTIILMALLYFLSGPVPALAALLVVIAGLLVFPLLIPWIPTPNFSTKGFLLGSIVAAPLFLLAFLSFPSAIWWKKLGLAVPYLLIVPSLVAFITLNYTGATPFTSKSGVKREIFAYFPIMFWMFLAGVFIGTLFRFIG
ncbi:MAG: carbon monoxide dehydrogenase [candidate division WOR-3 bacterium]|nr:MAG: carbon monoxide dehydrogenase [candidate division WOR-3 bacterium]